MRVMFAVFPAPAHFLPVVPYAWALQSAGHEVCVAAPPGVDTGVAMPGFHDLVTAAGLTAVPCGKPELLAVHDGGYPGFERLLPTLDESERYARDLGLSPADRAIWDVYYHFALLTIRNYHPPEPRQDVLALVDFARRWQPDLVIWDSWFPAGALAARASGAAHARLLLAPDYIAWAARRFAATGGAVTDLLAETLRPLADRVGTEVDEELLVGQWTIDPFPAGLRLDTDVVTVPARQQPYNGGGVLPEWLYDPPRRPRVALSLGVSYRMFAKGDWGRTAKFLEALGGLDVDVVATLNENQLLDVPDGVPANVRTVDYLPLTQLLPGCSALIHHGSPATFAAATAAGVPQLVADTEESTRLTARVAPDGTEWNLKCEKQLTASPIAAYVAGSGAGVRLDHQTQTAAEIRELLRQVLEEPAYRAGAAALHEEWLAAPSPVEIVPALEKLTAEHRCRGGKA
jgi:hypothetical protein